MAVMEEPIGWLREHGRPEPRLGALGSCEVRDQVRGLVAEFESVTGPRGVCGVRYRLSSLPALVVCAMTPAGHDSITAAAQRPGNWPPSACPATRSSAVTGSRVRRPCAPSWDG